jgi:DNA-binding CsgD family transcriptional regulator
VYVPRVAHEVVGRGAELAALEPFLARTGDGLAALAFEGEAGIGKSTVWQAAADLAAEDGWLVLTSRPARSEQGLTLGGLVDLLGGVSDSVLARLPGPQRDALAIALLRAAPERSSPDQRTLSVATSSLLRQLAERPLLMAIDDVQFLDEGSAAILAYALRRLTDRPIGLLLAVRTGAESKASDEIVGAVPADRLGRVPVGPLHLASLHRLFEIRLGRSFPRLVLVRVEEASRGNPLYALELGRALIRTGVPADPHASLPVPDTLGSLIARRVSALPAPTRRAMLLAASAAEPTLANLEAASPGFGDDLRPAIADDLVAIDRDVVRFGHPLFAQGVISLASDTDRRAAHAALAAATRSPDARARHLAQASVGPDEQVAAALADAASDARLRGATLDATALYQDASRLTPRDDSVQRLRRAQLAAECLFIDLSEYVEADRILEAAIAAAPAGPSRADALSLRGIIRYYHGRIEEAIALGEQALAEAGGDPLLRALVLGRLGYLVMQRDLDRGLALVDEAVRLEEGAGDAADPDTLANALLLRALGEFALIRPTRTADIDRGLALITDERRSWENEGADGSAFAVARHTDDLDRAIAMTRETIRMKSGPGGDDPFNVVMLSGLLVYRGEWAEAREQAEAAMAGYEREGLDVHPSWALRGLALVAAHDGRRDEARRWAEEGLERADERGDLVLTIFQHHILGFLAIVDESWADADAHLTAAAAGAARGGVRHPARFKLAGDQVEAVLALGDRARARAVVERLDEAARVAPTPWVRAIGARSRALLEAAEGDLEAAGATFERALLEHDHLPMPFERGRTLLAKGRLHRRRKERRLADETLREALACFESLGAPDWAAKARIELGRVGRRPHAPDSLTETERRVAQLAATGLTSREIAERAFLAPKTVGNVLGRVYEKLGIHSRAELGALIASGALIADEAARPVD